MFEGGVEVHLSDGVPVRVPIEAPCRDPRSMVKESARSSGLTNKCGVS